MTRLFLDDERMPPSVWEVMNSVIIRNYEHFCHYIRAFGCPDFISFDHDLGEGKSGYDCAKYLIQYDLDKGGSFIPDGFAFTVHSMNPIGAKNIQTLLDQYLKFKVAA